MCLLLCLLYGAPLTIAVEKTIALLTSTQGTDCYGSFSSHLTCYGLQIQQTLTTRHRSDLLYEIYLSGNFWIFISSKDNFHASE